MELVVEKKFGNWQGKSQAREVSGGVKKWEKHSKVKSGLENPTDLWRVQKAERLKAMLVQESWKPTGLRLLSGSNGSYNGVVENEVISEKGAGRQDWDHKQETELKDKSGWGQWHMSTGLAIIKLG